MQKIKEVAETPDIITQYFKQISKFPVLSKEEEIYYIKKIQQGDKEAYDYFIKSNLRLVVSIAKSYYHNTTMSFEDIIQEGNIGLINAISKFDLAEGCRFSTCATPWIKQSISRALINNSKTIRLPAHKTQLVKHMKNFIKEYNDKNHSEPTVTQVAKHFSISEKAVLEVFPYLNECISLDAPLETDDKTTVSETIQDVKNISPEEKAILKNRSQIILSVLETLSEQEKNIIIMRFGLIDGIPKTLDEVGAYYEVTKERIRQIEEKALRKLRQPIRANILKQIA